MLCWFRVKMTIQIMWSCILKSLSSMDQHIYIYIYIITILKYFVLNKICHHSILCALISVDRYPYLYLPGFSVTAPWVFIGFFSDENGNKVLTHIMIMIGNIFVINANEVIRRLGAVTENPGTLLANFLKHWPRKCISQLRFLFQIALTRWSYFTECW